MRTISQNLESLLQSDLLKFIMNQIRIDRTLDLEFRKDKAEVYYRGCELLSIEEKNGKFYFTKTENGAIEKQNEEITEESVWTMQNCHIPHRKDALDLIDRNGPKGAELDVQQTIIKENNLYKSKAEDTDYYIADMEYEASATNLRFDLLAVKSVSDRKDRSTPAKKLAIIELKYGSDAVYESSSNESSLMDHFKDLNNFIKKDENIGGLKRHIINSFNLKKKLDLISVSSSVKVLDENSLSEKPEYIILFANYKYNEFRQNPYKLIDYLKQIKDSYPDVFNYFDVKIGSSFFMGYGLYDECMIPYDEFVEKQGKITKDMQIMKYYKVLLLKNLGDGIWLFEYDGHKYTQNFDVANAGVIHLVPQEGQYYKMNELDFEASSLVE